MTWSAFFIARIGDQAGEIPSNQSYAESPLIEIKCSAQTGTLPRQNINVPAGLRTSPSLHGG